MSDWEKVCWCEVPHDPSCYVAQSNARLAEAQRIKAEPGAKE